MTRWRLELSTLGALICIGLLPATAHAQSAIGGTVKDTSGAVLPGVQVEVASDVLIEKTRSVFTGTQGEYKVVDLRPGTYVITFTLQGFTTFKREGLELRIVQSNDEGAVIGAIHDALDWAQAIVINPAAFTHYSVAIRDAVQAVRLPTVEVHLSNLSSREEFRHTSLISPV